MKNYEQIQAPTQVLTLGELLPGDILCTNGERRLAKKIQHFMKVQAHKWYNKEYWEYFNHMATVLDPETLEIGEAIAKGYDIHSIYDQYDQDDINRMIVLRPEVPFTNEEVQVIRDQANEWNDKGVKYEYSNFLWWIVYIYTKVYIGPKGEKAKRKLFCFESALMLWDEAREMFEYPGRETTVSVREREDIKVYGLTTL